MPQDLRVHYSGKRTIVRGTGTSDLREAQRIRDEWEARTTDDFAILRSGGTVARSSQWEPAELGRIMREETAKAERGDGGGAVELSFAAEAALDRIKGDAQRTAYLNALHGHEPINAFVDDYAAFRSDLREKTVEERRGIIRQFAEWAAKDDLTLPEVTRRVAGKYVSEKLETAERHRATARKHLTALTDYWAFLLARGHVASKTKGQDGGNPWTGQLSQGRGGGRRRAREAPPEERAFTDQEVRALLYGPAKDKFNQAYAPDLLDVLRVSLLSGLRLDEVTSLTAQDVAGGSIRVVAGKTDAAARTVLMHPDLKPIIAQRVPEGSPAAAPVFPDLHKLARPGDTFGKRFRRYRELAGVKDDREGVRRSLVNFHSARRWFAQQARHNGHPLETVKEVMGHVADRRDRVTLGYTGEASEAQRRALVESLRLPAE